MAEGMDDFVPRHGEDRIPGAFLEERVFTTTANSPDDEMKAAPRDAKTLADVVLGWQPLVIPGATPADPPGIIYPTRGDKCAVSEDDNGNYWVLSWSPYA